MEIACWSFLGRASSSVCITLPSVADTIEFDSAIKLEDDGFSINSGCSFSSIDNRILTDSVLLCLVVHCNSRRTSNRLIVKWGDQRRDEKRRERGKDLAILVLTV